MKIRPKPWPLECSQSFSLIWPTDLGFDPTWPFRTWPRFRQDKHSDKFSWWLDAYCGLYRVHKVSVDRQQTTDRWKTDKSGSEKLSLSLWLRWAKKRKGIRLQNLSTYFTVSLLSLFTIINRITLASILHSTSVLLRPHTHAYFPAILKYS